MHTHTLSLSISPLPRANRRLTIRELAEESEGHRPTQKSRTVKKWGLVFPSRQLQPTHHSREFLASNPRYRTRVAGVAPTSSALFRAQLKHVHRFLANNKRNHIMTTTPARFHPSPEINITHWEAKPPPRPPIVPTNLPRISRCNRRRFITESILTRST